VCGDDPVITVADLSKDYAGEEGLVRAVDGINFQVPPGKLMTLLGPSGCGKTTTLRCLAGLERPDHGEICIGDRVVVSTQRGVFIPVHKRKIGMVFQSYAIWPHMTVMENVCYPLGEMKLSAQEKRQRGKAALAVVGLEGLENRPSPNLSGGQQQRVALARALVGEPEILLLDEPLSNLDAKLRENMRSELRALQQRLGITTVYVTHDQTEALSMSDFVCVMSHGKIVEQGTPRELYETPKSQFVAEFLGMTNFISRCPHGCKIPSAGDGRGESVLSIRPEDIEVRQATSAASDAAWRGEVTRALFIGSHTQCEIKVDDQLLKAVVHHSVPVAVGDVVFVTWSPQLCAVVTRNPDHAGSVDAASSKSQLS
jgi:iron(III) transport system ATP-binding protein